MENFCLKKDGIEYLLVNSDATKGGVLGVWTPLLNCIDDYFIIFFLLCPVLYGVCRRVEESILTRQSVLADL